MKLQDILWTEKMQTLMQDEAQILFLAGATGCSKSLVAGHKFVDWMLNAPKEETQYYIICEKIKTDFTTYLTFAERSIKRAKREGYSLHLRDYMEIRQCT